MSFIGSFSCCGFRLKALSSPFSSSALLPTLWVCALRDCYYPFWASFHLDYSALDVWPSSEDSEISLSANGWLQMQIEIDLQYLPYEHDELEIYMYSVLYFSLLNPAHGVDYLQVCLSIQSFFRDR